MDSFMTQNFILVILLASVLITTVFMIIYLRNKRLTKSSSFKYYESQKYALSIITVVITVLTMIFSFYLKFNESKNNFVEDRYAEEKLNMEIVSLRDKIASLQSMKDTLFLNMLKSDSLSSTKGGDIEFQKRFELRISKIETNINTQKDITTSLRQAINPMKPDEILTIARLKDEVTELNKSITALDESLKIRQQNFEDSIKREITSSNSSTTLILVVLIPLVLNFLYTVWKDFKKPNRDKKEETKTT